MFILHVNELFNGDKRGTTEWMVTVNTRTRFNAQHRRLNLSYRVRYWYPN